MKRVALFVLMSGALILGSSLLTGCQTTPPQFRTVEVKHLTQAEGLGLTQNFVNCFNDSLREYLAKTSLADRVLDEGAAAPDTDAANSIVLEGRITEFKQGGVIAAGAVSTEIKVYRRSDHALLKTLTPKVMYKPSPFNTDKTIASATGGRTAYAIAREMKP